jgi:hypothetical protein
LHTAYKEYDKSDDVEPRVLPGPHPDGLGEGEDGDESTRQEELAHLVLKQQNFFLRH